MNESNDRGIFEKHTPIYPLPEDILKMSKDETICQFCGVSYLIHNEIKKLEDRVKELEKDLQNYELLKLKEKHFNQIKEEQNLKIQEIEDKLATRIQMISSLNNDIESRDLDINRLKKKCQDFENDNNSLIVGSESLKKKMLMYDSVVKETVLYISQLKSDIKRLELDSKDQKKLINQYISNINLEIITYSDRINREKSSKLDEIDSLKSQLDNLIKTNETQSQQISYFNKQSDNFQSIKNELASQIKILNEELNKSNSLNLKCLQLEDEKRNLMEQNSIYKDDNDNLKMNVLNSKREIEKLKHHLNSHQDSFSSVNKSFEKELKLKTDELQRVKIEFDLIKKQYEEKDKFEKEILSNHQTNINEVKSLKYEINRLNNQITDMQNERASMTLAHQCQITQLKDSFREKLRLSDDWPDKLAAELKKQQEKHNSDLVALESGLKENFQMEFDIQKQKYNEMYAKYQDISKEFEGNSRTRISDLESEKLKLANELKNIHEEKINTEKKLRQDMENLRNITKELHERLEKYTEGWSDDKLKQDMINKNSEINELENRLRSIENELNSSKEEVKLLQETVHNECMERQELLEKLEETRDELLQMKKNAYSNQQLIPLKASINKTNFASYKNGSGLIDINDPPDKLKNTHNYPKNLNDMFNGSTNQRSNGSATNSRRSSFSAGTNSANNNNDISIRSAGSDKSAADSSSKQIETSYTNSKTNFRASFLASNNSMPTEPVQLFKKINELNKSKNAHSSNSINTVADNKKRISLLLARKS